MKEQLGKLRAADVALALEACGEHQLAAELRAAGSNERLSDLIAAGKWKAHPWEHTEFQCAFLGPGPYSDGWGYLSDARSIQPDPSLAGASLNVTLDKLRVYQYPGGGQHQILFDFGAYHQQSDQPTPTRVQFSQKYVAQNGEGAGISGYPIFDALAVPQNGIDFSCSITNVANTDDETLLSFLTNDAFTKGLQMISGFNPALPAITITRRE